MSEINEVKQVEIPKYVCHKEVRAFKIGNISTPINRGDSIIVPAAVPAVAPGGIAAVTVDAAYMDKHSPKVGGYYVRYEDGYESFSSVEAFESGYTLME